MSDDVLVQALLAGGIKDDPIYFAEGECKAVPRAKAEYYCGAGWAKVIDGSIETQSPVFDSVTLDIQDIVHGQAMSKLDSERIIADEVMRKFGELDPAHERWTPC